MISDPGRPGVPCLVRREGVWGGCRPRGWLLHQQKQKDKGWTANALVSSPLVLRPPTPPWPYVTVTACFLGDSLDG